MSLAIVNIGPSHDGGAAGNALAGDAVVCDNGRIVWIGDSAAVAAADHRTVIDAAGATVVPGLIDSHVHTTFGDYTPRQQTVGFLDSYVHGGTTSVISASEVHVPGRPQTVAGVKALAVAAAHCFADYRPGGMTVHAGSLLLEPGLAAADFAEVAAAGVWLAKAGFGAVDTPFGYVPLVAGARAAGLVVMCHTGGGSIGGSQSKIGADALLAMNPHIAGHVNGGPTALSREENSLLVEHSSIVLQISHAGNLRSAIDICEMTLAAGAFARLLISTDTPTGTGVMPLGMLRCMTELSSLGPLTPRQAIAAATGNVRAVYGLDEGQLAVGAVADIAVIDAPVGSMARDAFAAMAIGDIPAVACVVTAGRLRFAKSRNTPAPVRTVRVLQ